MAVAPSFPPSSLASSALALACGSASVSFPVPSPSPSPAAAPPVSAWLEFEGFPAAPPAVVRQEGGTPAAMAAWLAAALESGPAPRGFAAACLAVPGIRWRPASEGLEAPAYRYRLTLHGLRRPRVMLQCWRHHPPPLGWQRRCGPLPLARFLHHCLPHSPQPAAGSVSRERPPGQRPSAAPRG